MDRALNPVDAARRSGFTLVEMVVVIAVVALLVGLLVPALMKARSGSQKLATEAQLNTIAAACLNYEMSFNALPGFAAENYFRNNTYDEFTSTENLVLSLLGGAVDTTVTPLADPGDEINPRPTNYDMATAPRVALLPSVDYAIDVKRIGQGPRVRGGRVYDAFYQPKENELVAVEGTVQPNNDNNMPELVDRAQSGLPILYFRGIPNKSRLASNGNAAGTRFYNPTGAANVSDVQFFRGPVCDYLESDALISSKYDRPFNQEANSLLNDTGAGNHGNANQNLGWLVADTKTMQLSAPPQEGDSVSPDQPARGRFMLMAAGDDGIYLNKQALESANETETDVIDHPDDLALFDDVIVFGQ